MDDVGRAAVWFVLVAFGLYSVLIWVGRPVVLRRALPRFIDDDGPPGMQARAMTISSIWFSGGLFLLFAANYVEKLLGIRSSYIYDINPLDLVFLAPGFAMVILWFASAGWMHPRWSIPSWFRRELHRGKYAPVHRTPPPPGPGLWARAWRARIPHVVLLAGLLIGGTIWTGDTECRRARGDVEACQAMIPVAWAAGVAAGLITAAVGLPLGWFTPQSGAKGERLRRRNLRLANISTTVAWVILGGGAVLTFLRGGLAVASTAALAWLGVVIAVIAIGWLRRELELRH